MIPDEKVKPEEIDAALDSAAVQWADPQEVARCKAHRLISFALLTTDRDSIADVFTSLTAIFTHGIDIGMSIARNREVESIKRMVNR